MLSMNTDFLTEKTNHMSTSSTGVSGILLLIATILLPPLGVALHQGVTTKFWISLVLTLLFFIPGLIYSLYVIYA